MAPIVDNNQFELPAVETPGKKRRRNADTNPFHAFSDQTFSIPSSTPIHNRPVDGTGFENLSFRYTNGGHNKENCNIFSDSCMEVKSIAELAAASSAIGDNPFEVVRKPPTKKKKRNCDFEESCFVNPGLNLNAADKPSVNPFEVVRSEETSQRENESCFVNGALNIKEKDNGRGVNPFEITRPSKVIVEATEKQNEKNGGVAELKGIENPALELPTFALAVPFTPSINRRINFQEIPADALTPCQMLSKNLVFSPEPNQEPGTLVTPKRNLTVTKRKSLSVISEEPLDIGEELDCYQLELENSINEAKVRKQKTTVTGDSTGGRKSRRSLIDVKHISNLSMKLKQLEESEAEEGETAVKETGEEKTEELTKIIEEPEVPTQTTFTVVRETTFKEEIRINVTNPDVQFEEVDDFEDEEQDVDLFANPAPFQRAYRKKEDPVEFKQPVIPDVQPSIGKSTKVKDVIRRSFRKLMQPKHQGPQITDLDEKPKSEESHGGLISTIRHSLRRKANKPKQLQEEYEPEEEEGEEKALEMSIIAEGPRSVFRQPATGEYRPISVGGSSSVDKVGSTLRSSLRRSTKDVKKHMMKNVFKKAAE